MREEALGVAEFVRFDDGVPASDRRTTAGAWTHILAASLRHPLREMRLA
jgi:hypothetical protein